MQHIAKVQPTIFATVPRVLEKVYAAVLTRIAGMSGVQKAIASWALSVGERYDVSSQTERNLRVLTQGGGSPPVQQMAEGIGRARPLSYFGRRGAWRPSDEFVRCGEYYGAGGIRPHGNQPGDLL